MKIGAQLQDFEREAGEPRDLATPIRLPNGNVLPNRLIRASLSEGLAEPSGRPSAELIRLYERWARERGYGAIITGNVMIDRRHLGEPGNAVLEDERDLDAFTEWASRARTGSTSLWMQINHAGRQAAAPITGNRPVAPSAIGTGLPGYMTPRELTGAEIEEIIARYATAASLAQAAGFDGVQLHGAHGYLISQFLSPLANQRIDEWGGDTQRRARFLIELVRAVRAAVEPTFAVTLKVNSADFQRGGFSEEESMALLEQLEHERLDLIEISGGTYSAPAMMGAASRSSTRQREAYFHEYAMAARKRLETTPLLLTGGFRTRTAIDAALAEGACDAVGVARPTCLDPDVGTGLVAGTVERAPERSVRVGLRPVLGRLTDLAPLDGAINLAWHTDQMHRMGRGLAPDPRRHWLRTAARLGLRFGPAAFKARRG